MTTEQIVADWVSRDAFGYGYLLDFCRRGARLCWAEDRGIALRNDRFSITYTGGEVPLDLPELNGTGLVLSDCKAVRDHLVSAHPDWFTMEAAQAIYPGKEPPRLQARPGLSVRPLTEADLNFVLENYHNPGAYESHIRQRIEEGMLGGMVDGALAGFAGIHQEGTMGLLEVLPQFRRRGLAEVLEVGLIAQQLHRGLLPYCHVRLGNTASEALQTKLGLVFDSDGRCTGLAERRFFLFFKEGVGFLNRRPPFLICLLPLRQIHGDFLLFHAIKQRFLQIILKGAFQIFK